MIKRFKQIGELLGLLSHKRGWGYLRFAKRPSFGAYKICRGLHIQCGPIGTIIDVGANRGQFALASHYFFPEADLHCFEPIPGHARVLKQRFARYPGIQIENKAMGAAAGFAEFHISEYDHLSSFVAPTQRRLDESPEARAKQSVQVEVVTLDHWFTDKVLKGPVLLKLDVQGFESEVLAGGREFLSKVDYLVYESSFEQMYEGEKVFGEMFDLVRSLGFELVAPLDFWTGPSLKICEVDLLWRRKKQPR